MFGDKELLPGNASKIIRFYGFSEGNLVIRLCAEDHHVIEIAAFFFDRVL